MKTEHLEAVANGPPLPKLAHNRRDAAALLGISCASLDRLVQRGLLRPSRALKKPIFAHSELERFLHETTGAVE